jgi:hypothetical protein
MMREKNEELSSSDKRMLSLDLKARKERIRSKSAEMAASEKGNTLSREDHKSMMREKNEEIANSEKNYNTMGRKQHRELMRSKSRELSAAEKGFTMNRKSYRNMLEQKSAEVSGEGKIEVISSAERIKKAKEKSQLIADYKAGYLNSAAERRARIRSFFMPGKYQANTVSEKLKKMKEKSSEIARYEGVVKQRKYNTRMHPSARYLGKYQLASMSERSDFHRKTTMELARSRRDYMPVYLKKRPEKPRYNRDVEKGLWND